MWSWKSHWDLLIIPWLSMIEVLFNLIVNWHSKNKYSLFSLTSKTAGSLRKKCFILHTESKITQALISLFKFHSTSICWCPSCAGFYAEPSIDYFFLFYFVKLFYPCYFSYFTYIEWLYVQCHYQKCILSLIFVVLSAVKNNFTSSLNFLEI